MVGDEIRVVHINGIRTTVITGLQGYLLRFQTCKAIAPFLYEEMHDASLFDEIICEERHS